MKLLIAIMMTLMTVTVSAGTQFKCLSNDASESFRVEGEFNEIPNRHGKGEIQLTITGEGSRLTKTGQAHEVSQDQIEFEDRNLQLDLRDSNCYKGNISTLVLNNRHSTMICRFTYPSYPTCTSWCCRYTCH